MLSFINNEKFINKRERIYFMWSEQNHHINNEFLELYKVAIAYTLGKENLFLSVNISARDTERASLELTLSRFDPRTEIEGPGRVFTAAGEQIDWVIVPYTRPIAKFTLMFDPNMGYKREPLSRSDRNQAEDFFDYLDQGFHYNEKMRTLDKKMMEHIFREEY